MHAVAKPLKLDFPSHLNQAARQRSPQGALVIKVGPAVLRCRVQAAPKFKGDNVRGQTTSMSICEVTAQTRW